MYESCLKKQSEVKALFSDCATDEAKFERIIALGRQLAKMDPAYRTPDNRVKGCQSLMYLHSKNEGEVLVFEGEANALISAGLAALLIKVYSGETPETILKCPPAFLDELKISSALTPNRANGLYSVHLRMKQDALKVLAKKPNQ